MSELSTLWQNRTNPPFSAVEWQEWRDSDNRVKSTTKSVEPPYAGWFPAKSDREELSTLFAAPKGGLHDQ